MKNNQPYLHHCYLLLPHWACVACSRGKLYLYFISNKTKVIAITNHTFSYNLTQSRLPNTATIPCAMAIFTVFRPVSSRLFFCTHLEQAHYDLLKNNFYFLFTKTLPNFFVVLPTVHDTWRISWSAPLLYVCKHNASSRLTQTSINVLHHLQFLPVICQFSVYYKEQSLMHYGTDRLQWSVV
jgi:hypothetical protein